MPVLTQADIRRKARLALILRTRPPALARAKRPRDGDGDGFYSPWKGAPDKTPVPPKVSAPAPVHHISQGAKPLDEIFRGGDKHGTLLRDIQAGLEGEYGGTGTGRHPGPYSVEIDYARIATNHPAGPYLMITGKVHDADGREIGEIVRNIHLDSTGGWAHHDILQLKPAAQGTGFAEAFNANLYDWYRRSGITRVELYADLDVGSYTWARAGYDFASTEAAQAWLNKARQKIDYAIAHPDKVPSAIRSRLADLDRYIADIEAGRVAAFAPDIAAFGRREGQRGRRTMWPGKWLMLQGPARLGPALHMDMSWDGVLHLTPAP